MNFASIVFGSIAFLVKYHSDNHRQENLKEKVRSYTSEQNSLPVVDTYDFIVVGGGTAGCAVASRLSENPVLKILVLEIGGPPPPQTDVPGFKEQFVPLPEVSFQYNAHINQKSSPRIVVSRAGKILGGTSILNGMVFNRGNPQDYDNWAKITGDDSWTYANLLPYFKKTETYLGEYPVSDQHGTEGPIPVTSQKYTPGLSVWLEAGVELGYPNTDPSGPQGISIGPIEFSRRNGRRVSSYEAYIRPIEETRTNLTILNYAEVTEIILENGKAVGVTYNQHGILHLVKTSKEIILSAGAYGTPILLMKSGIGPTEHLDSLNIKSKMDLPVGRNLRDHSLVPLRIIINDTSHAYLIARDMHEDAVKLYSDRGEGPLSTDKTLVGQGFAVSTISARNESPNWPDIQFSLYSQDFSHFGVPQTEDAFNNNENETGIFILTLLGRPLSTGTLKLKATNISNQPIIDSNLLSNPTDIQVFIEAIKKTLEIFETTEAYRRIGARYSTRPLEACARHEFRSDAYWECYLWELMIIANHASGSCRMGSGEDSEAVVDSKLKVRGVDGLRVVDASIMPEIVNANPQATVYMIAEKISAEILKEYSKPGLQDIKTSASKGRRQVVPRSILGLALLI